MIRRNNLVLLASFCLLVLVASSAQAGGTVFAGLSNPMGDFGDWADMGFHGGVSMGVPAAPTLSVGGMGSYHYWSVKDADDNTDLIEVLGFAKLTTPGGLFGQVGLGMGFADSDSELATALGGGYSFTMIELTALYHMVGSGDDKADFLTISAGIGF